MKECNIRGVPAGTHVSNLAALCTLAFKKAFKSKQMKENLAAGFQSKLLSADIP